MLKIGKFLPLCLAGVWIALIPASVAFARETKIKWEDVPKAVKNAAGKRFENDQVTEIVKKEHRGKIIFEFEVQKNGNELDYSFGPDGTILGIEGDDESGRNAMSRASVPEDAAWTDSFAVDTQSLLPTGRNRYFILEPGYQLQYKSQSGKKEELLTITVLNETQTIDGVVTRIVEERESKGGRLVEVSRNYFAIDPKTNDVYYFGEDVDMYGKDGEVDNHEGSWQSGKTSAKFGLVMPGNPRVGDRHYQEMAPEKAMDRAEVTSLTRTLETPAGTYSNCLEVEESTPLEPGNIEYKVYAPDVGLIKDGSILLVKHGFLGK